LAEDSILIVLRETAGVVNHVRAQRSTCHRVRARSILVLSVIGARAADVNARDKLQRAAQFRSKAQFLHEAVGIVPGIDGRRNSRGGAVVGLQKSIEEPIGYVFPVVGVLAEVAGGGGDLPYRRGVTDRDTTKRPVLIVVFRNVEA